MTSRFCFYLALLFLLLLSVGAYGETDVGTLQAGCARVDITCPVGIPLIGSYGKPSEAVLDRLYVRAMVLDDGANTIVIVSADLLYTPLEGIVAPVRAMIKERIGIDEQNVLICATHTHSGPEVFSRSKLPSKDRLDASRIDRAYLGSLREKIAGCVVTAYKNMRPVRIGVGRGQIPEVVFNRRTIDPSGACVMTFSVPPEVAATRRIQTDSEGNTTVAFTLPKEGSKLKFGPIDPELCVLRVEDAAGDIVGSIVNFGCHPVCVYPHASTSISADYPGDVTGLVEEGEGGICLFTLAPAGNMVPYQRGLAGHRQMGRAIGGEAVKRLQFVRTTDDAPLKSLKRNIKFPAKKPASADQAGDEAKTTDFITSEIQVMRIGDIYILGLPGEVLVEIGLEIKRKAGVDNLFVISLSNDAIGYVCHDRAYEQGGYEPGPATSLAKGTGEIMVREALDIIAQIKQGK